MFPHSAHSRNESGRIARDLRPDTRAPELALVEAAVAAVFAVPVAHLRAARRGTAPVAFARQTAIYLAHTVLGLSYTAIARAVGRDRTTVAHACRILEQRRDDPAIDAIVGRLEHAIDGGADEHGPGRRCAR
jgi:chromosomal replication initiation ATPase DnaA